MTFNETTIPVYYQAVKLMFSGRPVGEGMLALERSAREMAPHPVWDRLRRVDYAGAQAALTTWIDYAVASRPADVAILFFCLSDLGDQMTLFFMRQLHEPAGTEGSGDDFWGAFDDSRYADVPAPVLTQMAEIIEAELAVGNDGAYTNPEAGWIAETCYPLAYAGLAVAQALQAIPVKTLLGSDARRRVAVFFGEGDDFLLGEISEAGFHYHPVPAFIA